MSVEENTKPWRIHPGSGAALYLHKVYLIWDFFVKSTRFCDEMFNLLLLTIIHTHMGQIPQDGDLGQNVAFFFKSRAFVRPNLIIFV